MYAFFILLILGVILLWFLLAFSYKFLGKICLRIFSDTKEAMKIKEISEEKKGEN